MAKDDVLGVAQQKRHAGGGACMPISIEAPALNGGAGSD